MNPHAIDVLVDSLSLEEQVALLSGEDFWSVPAIARAGIGKLRVTDGPNGARGSGSLIGGVTAAAFPVGIAIGASWSPALAQSIGSAIAEEVKSKGAHVSLAPTVNIQRSVTNGRNFECYSEDPELTGHLASAYVTGLQSQGIAPMIKHFVGNESEIERTTISSDIDERTLREVYLRPFEMAVRQAGAWGVMSSYNKLNGTYTAEHRWLLTDVLRGDWGFDGVVVSDWFGSRSCQPTIDAGLTLEMPGPTRDRGDTLVDAVRAGQVDAGQVRALALDMLRLMARVGVLHDPGSAIAPFEERADDRAAHRTLIRRAAADCAVLLKNAGALPLSPAVERVAVIGPNAREARIMGGGSAQLNPHYAVSPWQGLQARFGEDALTFAPGCTNHRWEPLLTGDFEACYYNSPDLSGEVVYRERLTAVNAFWIPPFGEGKVNLACFSARITGRFQPSVSGVHRVGVHSAGFSRVIIDGTPVVDAWSNWTKGRTFFEEGCDEVVGEVRLEAGKPCEVVVEVASRPADNLHLTALRAGIGAPLGDAAIADAVSIAKDADVALVFVGRSGEWDTEGSDLENITLPGRQDELVAAVAAANPNTVVVLQTGGPVEMPWHDDVAAILQAWYPGQECGNAIADVLLGDAEPGGRLAQTFPKRWHDNPTHSQDPEIYPGLDGHVRYEEGRDIGYRHYQRYGITPLFPFGFGLSYTRFELSDLQVSRTGEGAEVQARLTNTGDRAGSTVVQVYLSDGEGVDSGSPRRLRAFRKVCLKAGESADLAFALTLRDFAWFDVAARNWCVESGEYRLDVGFSAVDTRLSSTLKVPSQTRLPV